MTQTNIERNRSYAKEFMSALSLRYEPVAVRLIREDEDFPKGYDEPQGQLSYCQAVERAKEGESFKFTPQASGCNVGASALGIVDTPEKVKNGEFHFKIGAHDTQDATAAMIAARSETPFKTKGAVIAPLSDADFEPDVLIFTDIPERMYWFVPLSTAENGGRAAFTTAPFQAACVDSTTVPMRTGNVNMSLGCYGCRKRSNIKPDELMVGVPWGMVPDMVKRLGKYREGILTTAKRD